MDLCSQVPVSGKEENLTLLIGAAQGSRFTPKMEGKSWSLSPEMYSWDRNRHLEGISSTTSLSILTVLISA